MIYVDTSVALAQLLSEDRRPPGAFWADQLVSSRLLEYETWTRLHAGGFTSTHGEHLETLLGRFAFVELARPVLRRALEPFPVTVRTLDALHLASVVFLQEQNQKVSLATYDHRMREAAEKMRIPVLERI